MEKLEKAQEIFKSIHATQDAIPATIDTSIPGWTILISPNDFEDGSEKYPLVEIITNDNLLKLYDYAERMSEGDELFDNFEESFTSIYDDDISGPFVDLFYALVTDDAQKICQVMDFEEYIKI